MRMQIAQQPEAGKLAVRVAELRALLNRVRSTAFNVEIRTHVPTSTRRRASRRRRIPTPAVMRGNREKNSIDAGGQPG